MYREIITRSAVDTLNFGQRLGGFLASGDVVALVGPLGVGKTVLAKGIGRGLDVMEEVLSPSFNIILEYEGRIPFRHVDFYRLGTASEAFDIGIEEYIGENGVTAVEWADRIPEVLPGEHLLLEMSFAKGEKRNITIRPKSKRFVKLVEKMMSSER